MSPEELNEIRQRIARVKWSLDLPGWTVASQLLDEVDLLQSENRRLVSQMKRTYSLGYRDGRKG